MTWMRLFVKQVHREWLLCLRQLPVFFNACLFFLMFILFFPLTLSPEPALLRMMVPGIVWMALLLACLMSAERLFDLDYEYGVLEQWLVSGYPLSVMIIARILVQSLLNLLPALLLCPLIAFLYGLNLQETGILMSSLALATPALLALCALAAVSGVGLHQRGALMALIVLPLTLPLLIFGSSILNMHLSLQAISGHLALLLALSLLSVSCLPFAIAGIIRSTLVD